MVKLNIITKIVGCEVRRKDASIFGEKCKEVHVFSVGGKLKEVKK